MIEIKAKVDAFNIFQLMELQKHISARMASLGSPPTTSETGATFKRGDLIEFYSTRKSRQVRARVDRINGKTLSCHEVDTPLQKWRVPPSMCRLVGADKVPLPHAPDLRKEWVPVAPASGVTTRPAPAAAEPMPAGAGAW